MSSERRRYVRHPIHFPIAIRRGGGDEDTRSHIGNLSEGGLCFDSPLSWTPESTLEVSFPVGDRLFTLQATVVRCVASDDKYLVGVAFLEPQTSFRMKLAEQVLRIEELRRDLSRERGEEVSNEEAARLWVDDYARDFAELYSGA